jgi:hypothetical protein
MGDFNRTAASNPLHYELRMHHLNHEWSGISHPCADKPGRLETHLTPEAFLGTNPLLGMNPRARWSGDDR